MLIVCLIALGIVSLCRPILDKMGNKSRVINIIVALSSLVTMFVIFGLTVSNVNKDPKTDKKDRVARNLATDIAYTPEFLQAQSVSTRSFAVGDSLNLSESGEACLQGEVECNLKYTLTQRDLAIFVLVFRLYEKDACKSTYDNAIKIGSVCRDADATKLIFKTT